MLKQCSGFPCFVSQQEVPQRKKIRSSLVRVVSLNGIFSPKPNGNRMQVLNVLYYIASVPAEIRKL